MNHADESVVVVPSVSIEPDQPGAGSLNQAYEERFLFLLLLLRQPQLATAKGGPAVGKRDEKLTPIALFYGPLPTGLTVSKDKRLFVCFPRWGLPTNYTVAEVVGGELRPFPDADWNRYLPNEPQAAKPGNHFVSVQSVVCDDQDRLWILDTGSVNMGPIVNKNAPKLWGYDLKTQQAVHGISFDGTAKPNSYLNDVRFDLKRGKSGTAYITDSGAGGIIVVDLASGQSWRKLDGHPSTMADKNLTMMVEGQPMLMSEGRPIRLTTLAAILERPQVTRSTDQTPLVIVLAVGDQRLALVPRCVGRRHVPPARLRRHPLRDQRPHHGGRGARHRAHVGALSASSEAFGGP